MDENTPVEVTEQPVEQPAEVVAPVAPVELDSVEQANKEHSARLDQDGPTGGIYALPEAPAPASEKTYLGADR